MLVHNVFLFILLVFKWNLQHREHWCYIVYQLLFVICVCGYILRQKYLKLSSYSRSFMVFVLLSSSLFRFMPGKGHSMRHPLKNIFPMRFFVFHTIVWRMCFVHSPYSVPAGERYWWKAVSAWDKTFSRLLKKKKSPLKELYSCNGF